MRLGIIGGGFGIDCYLPAIRGLPGVEVVALADSGSGRALERLLQPDLYCSSWRELLSLGVDAVCIATPPRLHFEMVQEFVGSSKHILCEKPFGQNAIQSEQMAAAARHVGVAAAVTYQYRFEPGFQALKHFLDEGRVGRLNFVDCTWLTSGRSNPNLQWSWRNDSALGGGVIGAFLSHVVDLIKWLANSEVAAVQEASTEIFVSQRPMADGRMASVTAEDLAQASLELSSGIMACCRVSNCNAHSLGMKMELHGDNGTLVYTHTPPFSPETQQVFLHAQGHTPQLIYNAADELSLGSGDTRLPALRKLLQSFLCKALGGEAPDLPTFDDGFGVQRVLQAVRHSAASHSKVECLPLSR